MKKNKYYIFINCLYFYGQLICAYSFQFMSLANIDANSFVK